MHKSSKGVMVGKKLTRQGHVQQMRRASPPALNHNTSYHASSVLDLCIAPARLGQGPPWPNVGLVLPDLPAQWRGRLDGCLFSQHRVLCGVALTCATCCQYRVKVQSQRDPLAGGGVAYIQPSAKSRTVGLAFAGVPSIQTLPVHRSRAAGEYKSVLLQFQRD
jgi:hypothetical protein